jgi:hypothetical protein
MFAWFIPYPWRRRQFFPPKCCWISIGVHSVTPPLRKLQMQTLTVCFLEWAVLLQADAWKLFSWQSEVNISYHRSKVEQNNWLIGLLKWMSVCPIVKWRTRLSYTDRSDRKLKHCPSNILKRHVPPTPFLSIKLYPPHGVRIDLSCYRRWN